MVKKNFLFVLLLIISITLFSQEKKKAQYYFGICILDNGAGQMVRFGTVRVSLDGSKKITYSSKQNFLLKVAGHMESRANPDKINNWKEYKVNWKALDLLWKLKYSEYPYDRRDDKEGWANLTFGPSPGQLKFLSKYGFKKSINDFIYGDNMYALLIDIQNPEWQYNYSMQ